MSDYEEAESSNGNVTPPPPIPPPMPVKKKKIYHQSFKKEWLENTELNWVQPDPEDKFTAWCTVCRKKLSSINKSSLIRHNRARRHLKNLAKKRSGSLLQDIKTAPELSVQDEVNRVPEYVPVVLDPIFQEKVANAEELLADFLNAHNLPFRQANELMHVIKRSFPDSEIAKQVNIKLGHYQSRYREREEQPTNENNKEIPNYSQPEDGNEIICRVVL